MPETLENETTAAAAEATDTTSVTAGENTGAEPGADEARAALPAEPVPVPRTAVGVPVQYLPDTKNQPEGPGPKAAIVTARHENDVVDLVVFLSRSTHFVHRVPMGTSPGTWRNVE